MERLRYNKIKNFIADLNTREKRYTEKKLREQIIDEDVAIVNFSVKCGDETIKIKCK